MERDESESDQAVTESVETQTESELESDSLETPTEPLSTDDEVDEKWRFAYDVVKTVIQRSKGITLSDAEQPPNESFLFTDVHRDDVVDFLEQNGRYLKKLVGESTKENDDWNYGDDNYLHCKRKILEEYKPEIYKEKEFVRLCAGLAYVAIGNQRIQHNLNAVTGVVNELHSWMKEALMPGGTLQDSTWVEKQV